MIRLLLINKEDIKKVFSMKDAIEADKKAFELYSCGKTNVPLRTNINIPKAGGQCLFMPAYVDGINSVGVKIISVFPGNVKKGKPTVPATMVLLDGTTGEVCAIINGTYLTQMRTGAAAGAATDILARKDAKIGALFGTGGQAGAQLEAMLAVRNLECVRVFDIDPDRASAFVSTMREQLAEYNAEIVAESSPDRTIDDADIITTVTTSRRPVFDGRLVKEGAHINGVGAYTPDMQEIDEYIIKKADKVFVESKDAALSEAGDLIIPINKGIIGKDRINGELGEVILGRVAGRESDEHITIFKTVGIAVQDVVTAEAIYRRAVAAGVGTDIEL
jgi:ornithine cyclodeaminase